MEDMTARQFLWRHIWPIPALPLGLGVMKDHFLSADDACSIAHGCQFFLRGVGIALVHVSGRSLITMQGFETRYKGACGDVDVSNNVERESIEGDNDGEEEKIDCQFEEV